MNIFGRAGRFMAQAATGLTSLVFPRGSGSWLFLNRTSINYANEVIPSANSAVLACLEWIGRAFPEAPIILQEWLADRKEWENHERDEVLDLLERPNPFYNGTTLLKATVMDVKLGGSTYWVKLRSATGRVVQLWWVPGSMMEPKGDSNDPTVFIDHYDYSPNGQTKPLSPRDVIQFRNGIDPKNPRKGFSPMQALFREIFTDDEAANMVAALLRNMGVPGIMLSPEGAMRIDPEEAEKLKQVFLTKFTGDKRGEPMVVPAAMKVQQFGFSPEQMKLRELRAIPEERITAVLGVNAAVVGLGSGLATTKVGATLREYREEATEGTIIPLYREIASELTHQLLVDFRDTRTWRLTFDLSKVRVLQEDELKRTERVARLVTDGIIRISEGRRALGFSVEPEHEIYLRPANLQMIPAGPLRIQQNANANRQAALQRALVARLLEPGADVPAALAAYRMLEAETRDDEHAIEAKRPEAERLLGLRE